MSGGFGPVDDYGYGVVRPENLLFSVFLNFIPGFGCVLVVWVFVLLVYDMLLSRFK